MKEGSGTSAEPEVELITVGEEKPFEPMAVVVAEPAPVVVTGISWTPLGIEADEDEELEEVEEAVGEAATVVSEL